MKIRNQIEISKKKFAKKNYGLIWKKNDPGKGGKMTKIWENGKKFESFINLGEIFEQMDLIRILWKIGPYIYIQRIY